MTAVHQVLPVFAAADAIGQHTLQVQRVLRGMGLRSDIFARDIHAEVRPHAKPLERLPDPAPGEPTWLLYQLSTGGPTSDWVLQRPEPLVLDYHNITPAELFDPWEPAVGVELRLARLQLAQLAPRAVLGLADSAYNAAELRAAGCREAVVAPILLDTGDFAGPVDPAVAARLAAARAGGGADWLFVGRQAPNKAQHDVIGAFAAYRHAVDPKARLHLVGGPVGSTYPAALAALVAGLGLDGAVELAGSVTAAALAAHYAHADVFVCLSDHEGFCVPLLEALHHRVPVVAYASTAVPETLGGGGLLLPDKSPAVVASAVARVLADAPLRARLADAGSARLADFALPRTAATFTDAIATLVAGT